MITCMYAYFDKFTCSLRTNLDLGRTIQHCVLLGNSRMSFWKILMQKIFMCCIPELEKAFETVHHKILIKKF